MKRCDSHRNRLMDYLDGRLSRRKQSRLEAHLDQCPACRRELDTLRKTLMQIRRHRLPYTPPSHLDSCIIREARNRRPAKNPLPSLIFQPLPITAAATVLILVVTGVFLSRYGSVEHAVVGRMEPDVPAAHAPGRPGSTGTDTIGMPTYADGAGRETRASNAPAGRPESLEHLAGDTETKQSVPAHRDRLDRGDRNAPSSRNQTPIHIHFYDAGPEERRKAEIASAPPEKKKSGMHAFQPVVPEPPKTIALSEEQALVDIPDAATRDGLAETQFDVVSAPKAPEIVRFHLEPGVTAPEITHQVLPDYPSSMEKLGTGGFVEIRAVIDARGRLSDVSVQRTTHKAFSAAVKQVLPAWRFEPGRRNGNPTGVPCSLFFKFGTTGPE